MHRRIITRLQLLLATAFLSSATVITIPVVAQEVDIEVTATEEVVESTLATDVNLTKAVTTADKEIPIDQLEFLVQPLTVEELQVEASAWLVLAKNKVDRYSATEVAIKRINKTIDDEEETAALEEEAGKKLKEALTAQDNGDPEAEAKLEEAREAQRVATKALRVVEEDKKKLKASPGYRSAVDHAQIMHRLSVAEAILQYAKEARQKFAPGSPDYASSTVRIDSLARAIVELNRAEEQKLLTSEGLPEYADAIQRFKVAKASLEEAIQIPGAESLRTKLEKNAKFQILAPEEEQTDKAAGEDATAAEPKEEPKLTPEEIAAQLKLEVAAQSELKVTLVENLPIQQKERDAVINRLKTVLTALERKGGDPTPFQKYIDAATITRLDVTDTQGLGIRITNWLTDPEGGLGVVVKAITFVVIATVSWFASLIIARFSQRLLTDVLKASKLFQGFAVNIIKRTVFIAGICLALATIGVDLGPILAVVGGLSFILAFALQSNLGNFASGLMLLVNKPFDVGDEVKVGGFWAYVESISLANTKLKGFDGSAISLPNNTVWGSDIINYTHSDLRKVSMGIEIKFSQDVDQISQIWTELASAHPKVLADPGPGIFPWNATYNYNIWVALLAWSTTDDYWDVYVDLLKTLQKRLDEANIELAAPVQNINLHDMNGTSAIAGQPPSSAIDVQAVAASNGESGA